MSSATSNSSARRRRTQPSKPNENKFSANRQPPPPRPIDEEFHYESQPPVYSIPTSIKILNNKISILEKHLIEVKLDKKPSENTQDKQTIDTLNEVKVLAQELSAKVEKLDYSIGKINLVLGLHETFINKVKTMVDFENVEHAKKDGGDTQLLKEEN
ncbi:MAG: hypothetical protein CMF82_03785 [Candidatus Marinimicrobia bacterium]|nr:hypothetical protein [Candidatus Neomarinimicrobiota bacterium]|tara:strand:+ start:333 stop:803 length:471 start_codon:yes stop_codon:yes gene_type:complete